jgi:hypothetical protein
MYQVTQRRGRRPLLIQRSAAGPASVRRSLAHGTCTGRHTAYSPMKDPAPDPRRCFDEAGIDAEIRRWVFRGMPCGLAGGGAVDPAQRPCRCCGELEHRDGTSSLRVGKVPGISTSHCSSLGDTGPKVEGSTDAASRSPAAWGDYNFL